jgi:hypothetical protein
MATLLVPLSACFAFANYGPVWEVGGVVTAPAHRRMGFGARVVAWLSLSSPDAGWSRDIRSRSTTRSQSVSPGPSSLSHS